MAGKVNIALWDSEKYVSWPFSHAHPIVRVPTPSGTPESKTIPMLPGESEESALARCLQYRNERGVQVWGSSRWAELLNVQARSVARHRAKPAGPQTGVFHYEKPGSAPAWIATWYELMPDGKRRKRSKGYSYGTPRALYDSSEKAKSAAIERRNREETRWYCTTGAGTDRTPNPL
ncbi:hypothetical protein EFK68_03645 [Pseudomonas aeruginosa]|nr:hypothetical protein EFK68_03645 [Pseudomonas aeruginosa]